MMGESSAESSSNPLNDPGVILPGELERLLLPKFLPDSSKIPPTFLQVLPLDHSKDCSRIPPRILPSWHRQFLPPAQSEGRCPKIPNDSQGFQLSRPSLGAPPTG